MTLSETLIEFLPRFAAGLAGNVSIAFAALALGLTLGWPLAWLQRPAASPLGRARARLAAAWVGLMRAAPTFVLMFFLLNAMPGPWGLLGFEFRITPWGSCTIALACYCMAYISDNLMEARRRSEDSGLRARTLFLSLIVPAIVRVFFVMVLSSGFAATVGVNEAVSVTISTLERLPDIGHRLGVLGVVVLLFTLSFQAIYAGVQGLSQRLQGMSSA